MKMLALGAEFMVPFWEPEIDVAAVELHRPLEAQIESHRDATFAYAMNTIGEENIARLLQARDVCKHLGIPLVYQCVEDPNATNAFVTQPVGFDVICTSDEEQIPVYQTWHQAAKVIWLPLACQPAMHYPAPVADAATDLIFIGNWYTNHARMAAVRTVLDPLLDAGYSLALYAYQSPTWPERYRKWWRGPTSCYDVAQFYPAGKVALGMNNQAWGTAMTSMRTFEVLACGKPFLSFHSDAYARLGFKHGEHFCWTDDPKEAVALASVMLEFGDPVRQMVERGRQFVLEHHTYQQRLATVLEALGIRQER